MNTVNINEIFPFQLDEFQLEAIEAIDKGNNVLVCAPTGAGKTAIAEYAIHHALATERKIFYTSPLKALSNQKYHDLCDMFGKERVGLLTGDQQYNREASILVMTTEIFRNILYKAKEDNILDNIGFLVLDECHYMKDADRGTVWEECIIYCPEQAQIIGLSATIGNPKKLANWIESVHLTTTLVETDHRPVPLRHHYMSRHGLDPLTTPNGKLNKKLLKDYFSTKSKKGSKGKGRKKYELLPQLSQVIRELHKKELLPAIYFLFSRKACANSLKRVSHMLDLDLLTLSERKELNDELERACEKFPWLREHSHLPALRQGIAAHHAGLLPALKNIVERLFQKNLIKIVFATETLAAGINMPARTTVISQVSKRTDSGFRLLESSEFLQMAGRAGRRGMDEVGHTIILETAYEGLKEIADLVQKDPEPLHSAFTPSYTMILNLATRLTMKQAKELIQLSFARYENIGRLKSIESNLKTANPKKKKRLIKESEFLKEIPWIYFEQAYDVLKELEYIDSEFNLTSKGKWAADLRCDNIVFFAELISGEYLESLSTYELAALATALTTYDLRMRDDYVLQHWGISEAIVNLTPRIYDLIKLISSTQEKYGLEFNIPFNTKLITLGFDWAIAESWGELLSKYPADEGDLVKIFKQASDLLKQLTQVSIISDSLRQNARAAFDLLYRAPISD